MEPLSGEDDTTDPGETTVVTRGKRLSAVDVEGALGELPRPTVGWSAGQTDQQVAAGGAIATVTAAGADRFERVRRVGEALFAERTVDPDLPPAARPRLFGGFGFHSGDNANGDSPWTGFQDALFVLPAVLVVRDGDETWLVASASGANAPDRATKRLDRWAERLAAVTPAPTDPPGVRSRTFSPDEAGWRTQVEAAVERIERGPLRKVVLAQAQTVELAGPVSTPDAYARLTGTYPDCFRFLFAPTEGGEFFGATPERLVSRQGRTVRTEALAGSTGRGETPDEDEWQARDLRESAKDVHEHDLVVEAIKDQLEPAATSVSTGDRTVRQLATVQHLQTPVTADLAEDDHVLSLVEALHPTPAVGGLPPDLALETIRETEAFERGWYASPVGWFDAAGNGTFAVAIRSALVRDDRATLFAGNGIVADSDPDRELDEVSLKYRPILDTLES